MAARTAKQLTIITDNKTGMLAEITGNISAAGVNIDAICAYAMDKKAYFMIITNDNEKAMEVLKDYNVKEDDVVVFELDNKIGAAKEVADKLKEANIDLEYVLGTTSGSGPATLVLSSNNNAEAVKILS